MPRHGFPWFIGMASARPTSLTVHPERFAGSEPPGLRTGFRRPRPVLLVIVAAIPMNNPDLPKQYETSWTG